MNEQSRTLSFTLCWVWCRDSVRNCAYLYTRLPTLASLLAGQGSIAEQLLVNPNPRCMDDDLLLDVGPVLQMPEQADALPVEDTPLDNCLAQLTSETAPSLRIPGSDGE